MNENTESMPTDSSILSETIYDEGIQLLTYLARDDHVRSNIKTSVDHEMHGSDHYSILSGGSMRAATSAASLPRLLMKPISARQFRGAEIGLDS